MTGKSTCPSLLLHHIWLTRVLGYATILATRSRAISTSQSWSYLSSSFIASTCFCAMTGSGLFSHPYITSANVRSSLSCGIPIYANMLEITCKNCSRPLKLYLNPRIIGTLIDETGCIAPGKLLWSERAWEQLLGRTVKEVTEMTNEEIRWLEQRMMFMRMHLVFGWEESVGRLAVLGMRA